MKRHLMILAATGIVFLRSIASVASEIVTVDNYVRAETDTYFASYVRQGAFGKFLHHNEPTPINNQFGIHMQRDTLYSFGVFDLSEPVTIVKPDTNGRFQSMLIINQNHSMLPVAHGPGEFMLSMEQIGTRYIFVAIRTFVNHNDPADMKVAKNLQERIKVLQNHPGNFEIPGWNQASLQNVRDAINVLAATRPNSKSMFSDRAKLNPISHLPGKAYRWGGNPNELALYDNIVTEQNNDEMPYSMTLKDVPIDVFGNIRRAEPVN